MGFTKIFKLTSNEVGYCRGSYGSTALNGGIIPVSFKGITGTTYNGIINQPIVGVSGSTNGFARPLLLGDPSNASVPTTTTSISESATWLGIGSGDTVETEEDYCLASPYTRGSDYTLTNTTTYSRTYDGNKTNLSVAYTITALNDLTVREIGLFTRVMYSWTSSTSHTSSEGVLMYRKVLNAPLTISAGNSATVVLAIAAG